jgi:hypothetical protein
LISPRAKATNVNAGVRGGTPLRITALVTFLVASVTNWWILPMGTKIWMMVLHLLDLSRRKRGKESGEALIRDLLSDNLRSPEPLV